MDNTDNLSGENPGVLIKVGGNLISCDKFIKQSNATAICAQRWIEELRTREDKARAALFALMDAQLDLDEVIAYCDERAEREECK